MICKMKEKRKALHLSQRELSARVGCSQELISKAERGLPISVTWAKKIAQELGMQWVDFFKDNESF